MAASMAFPKQVIFLHCSSNNLSSTVLNLFLSAVERDGGLWPSRIRVDYFECTCMRQWWKVGVKVEEAS